MNDLIQRLRNPLSSVPKKECADALEKQQAEIEDWKEDQKENLRNQCDLQAEINTLKAQAANDAADAADAGRYRWLRENHAWWLLKHFPANKPYLDAVEVIDAAIDNAMKESQQ